MRRSIVRSARWVFFILAAGLAAIIWCAFSVIDNPLPVSDRIVLTVLITMGAVAAPAFVYEAIWLHERYRQDRGLHTEEETAQIRETLSRMQSILFAIVQFQLDCGRCPTDSEGVVSLVSNPGIAHWNGPYMGGDIPIVDAWGNPFYYKAKDAENFSLISPGPGQILGDSDDIRLA